MTLAPPTPNAPSRPIARIADVRAALATIPDPEIPNVSILDLGMIGRIDVDPDRLRVEVLPTFVGCPAVEMIVAAIEDRLAELHPVVEVAVSFATPWTTDRITPHGRDRLRQSGFAPPPEAGLPGSGTPQIELPLGGEVVACPYCGSRRTVLVSAFGPTQCRSIRQCPDCRQPFEAFKIV